MLEGGVRVSAFASGGMIPPAMRGKVLADPSQAIQLADWYHTFCALAGVDYLDAPANLPDNTDSLDMWPLLSGKVTASPRTEVVIAIEGNTGGGHSPSGQFTPYNSSALIVGDFKAIFGIAIGSAFWQGPDFPNASYTEWMTSMGKQWSAGSSEFCGTIDAGGCLFNIREDETEHVDLAKTMPAKLEELRARIKVLRQSLFNPDRCLPCKWLRFWIGSCLPSR